MGRRARLKYEKLALRLAQSRLSQNTWARRLGISKGYLSQMVNGKRLYPGDEVRNRLLQLLQAPFQEFFEMESEEDAPAPATPWLDWQHGRIRIRIDQLDAPSVRSGGNMIQDMRQDIRLSWRNTRKNPGLSFAIVLLLALGIGANSTIYSLVHASLLTPLPFPDSERVIAIFESELSQPGSQQPVSPAVFRDWQEQSRSFSAIAAFDISRVVLSGSGEPEELEIGVVSPEYFTVLGVGPLAGRLFTTEDSQPGNSPTVLISERFWHDRLGSDPQVTSTTLRLGGEPARILGVVPDVAGIDQRLDLWKPLVFEFELSGSRGAHYLNVLGRLAPGIPLETARSEMDGIARRMAREYPQNREEGVTLTPLLESVVGGNARISLLVLWGAVALILGIACVNAANLILSRSAARLREVALRRALGASAYRVWRQFIVESLQLSLLGGILGVLLAYASLPLVLQIIPTVNPRLHQASLNLSVLLFTLAVTLATGFLFGLAPALQSRKQDSWSRLREGSGALPGPSMARLRSLLLIAQIGLAVVLVTGATLLARTLLHLSSVDPGFDPENVLTVQLGLPENRYNKEQASQLFADLQQRLASLPGVINAGASAFLPLGGAWTFGFDIVGQPEFPASRKPSGVFRPVLGNYLESLGIRLLEGRRFDAGDRANSPLVVLINQTLAKRFFADTDPLGQKLAIGYGAGAIQPREIVGVVSDVRQWGLAASPFPAFYVPHSQVPFHSMVLVLKTSSPPLTLAPLVKARIWELDKELAPSGISTLEARVFGQKANARFRTFLVGSFAGLALLLALCGIYGLVSYWVIERVPEIGLRMALGAGPDRVFKSVLKRGGMLALSGLLVGLATSVLVLRLISGLLFEVQPSDPLTYLLVCVSMLLMALAASGVPAYRATRIDPVRALRQEN